MLIKPRKALNKAFLKIRPDRTGIELFKSKLILLLDSSKANESEEFHKNLISDFLKNTYYSPNYFINTKGRNDLVIHTSSDSQSAVGVIIEAKSPTNKAEMISEKNLNNKALQELVLYFLRERITHKNLEVKHLVATNLNEWYIFDAQIFDKLFAQNKAFVKQFLDFEANNLSVKKTDFFYKEIAKPYIATVIDKIEYTYFDLATYDTILRNADKDDDAKLIVLYKLLSPEHLLKLSFANDSNTLDKNFYNELLHLIGLTETKEGGKKLIQRPKVGERHSGSLLENTINQLDSLDKISRLSNPKQYGDTHQERLFTVGLELCITWVNRILFLKLLEAQLISYHKGDQNYAFLHKGALHDYDNLNALFFMVLAKKPEDRNERVKDLFAKVPYLNSSLFEPTDLEHDTLFISGLEDSIPLPLLAATVIKDGSGKKQRGNLNAIEYFFDFLDAYDFASEGSEDIQEDNKTLINASVLGLIFEKINGYKDGSFYTPSFITMYMCRETILRAVVQKFNETKGWNCQTFEEFKEDIQQELKSGDRKEVRKKANEIINTLRICDPAVGSGHFLVSALNELITIKSELNILVDSNVEPLNKYTVEVVNDELIITDEDGIPFSYNPKNKESQRVQETLFHEKQKLIENCLFGVDINPNSVKICRLRLWIELLKNAYYKSSPDPSKGGELEERRKTGSPAGGTAAMGAGILRAPSPLERAGGEASLETLPNIDINIKCGNSLIARFGLDADLKKALKQSKWNIESYKLAVDTYRNAESKEQKKDMERLIADIKGNFRSEIAINDPKKLTLEKKKGELFNFTQQVGLFERSKKEQTLWNKTVNTLSAEVQKLETDIEEIKSNKIYENAFEWRFEFPEVLNDAGDFVGFDVVIGNPPYGVKLDNYTLNILKNNFPLGSSGILQESYLSFIILGLFLGNDKSVLSYIVPNTWRLISIASEFRKDSLNAFGLYKVDTFLQPVFAEAVVDCDIIFYDKLKNDNVQLNLNDADNQIMTNSIAIKTLLLQDSINSHLSETGYVLIEKIAQDTKPLNKIMVIKNGVKPYEVGKGLPKQTRLTVTEKPFTKTFKADDSFVPLIGGSDFHKYILKWNHNNFISYGAWLAAPRDKELFAIEEKIIVRQTSDKIIANVVGAGFVMRNNTHILISDDSSYKLKFILALLNSKLFEFIYWTINPEKGEALAEVKAMHLDNLPIKITSIENQQPFIEKVDQILTLKQANPSADTSALEREIDMMVYELYGLTEEEIKVVEGE